MRKLSKGSPPSKPLLEASKAPLESNKVSVTPALEPMDLAARSKLRDSPAWASNSIWSESPGGLGVPQKVTGSGRRRGVEASKAPLESNKVSVTPALEPMDLAARSK